MLDLNSSQDRDKHDKEHRKKLPAKEEESHSSTPQLTSFHFINNQEETGSNLFDDGIINFNDPFNPNNTFSDFSDNQDVFFFDDTQDQSSNVTTNYIQNLNSDVPADTEITQNQYNYSQRKTFDISASSDVEVNRISSSMELENMTTQLIFEEMRESNQDENHEPHLLDNEPTSFPLSSSTRNSKRKVELNDEANMFKEGFYKTFMKKKKKFPKQLVKKIHNIKICPNLNLIKMPREYERRIDLYFQAFSQYANIILPYLHQFKEEIIQCIPELKELK